ncbi:unnamed protein product [Eretmochelys imbricata]
MALYRQEIGLRRMPGGEAGNRRAAGMPLAACAAARPHGACLLRAEPASKPSRAHPAATAQRCGSSPGRREELGGSSPSQEERGAAQCLAAWRSSKALVGLAQDCSERILGSPPALFPGPEPLFVCGTAAVHGWPQPSAAVIS